MVEVLIAGILMASALTAVSRISIAALSSSAHSSDRAKIEAAINDNIQTLQKEDSYLTKKWIINNSGITSGYIASSKINTHQSSEQACKRIAENTEPETPEQECIIDHHLRRKLATSKLTTIQEKDDALKCTTDIDCACLAPDLILRMHLEKIVPSPAIAAIERTFNYHPTQDILSVIYSSEGPEQQVGKEKRVIEMTPNFAANCYSTR